LCDDSGIVAQRDRACLSCMLKETERERERDEERKSREKDKKRQKERWISAGAGIAKCYKNALGIDGLCAQRTFLRVI
jgi:hypothetical protein